MPRVSLDKRRDRVEVGGAWCVMRDTFYFIHMFWSAHEVEHFSINVLEAHARDVGGFVFLDKAK
jgi:hypothetical protein